MKLYEAGPARSARVRWTLQELGVDFESVPVSMMAGDHRKPDFLAINPAGKIPVLDDDGLVLTESAAICIYLADKFPAQKLAPGPADLEQRAQFNRWIFFCVTELEQPLWRTARHQFVYPEEKRLAADIELAQQEFLAMAAVLEAHMQGRSFVAGDHFSVADIITAYTLDWATMYGWLADFPTLNAYLEQMYLRPAAPPRMAVAFAAMNR